MRRTERRGGVDEEEVEEPEPTKKRRKAAYKKPTMPVGAAAHRGPRKCSGCDQPGHTIKTCPKVNGGQPTETPSTEPPIPPGAVSRDEYERAKGMQAEGDNSVVVAREIGRPVIAIGKIFNSDAYEEYLAKF